MTTRYKLSSSNIAYDHHFNNFLLIEPAQLLFPINWPFRIPKVNEIIDTLWQVPFSDEKVPYVYEDHCFLQDWGEPFGVIYLIWDLVPIYGHVLCSSIRPLFISCKFSVFQIIFPVCHTMLEANSLGNRIKTYWRHNNNLKAKYQGNTRNQIVSAMIVLNPTKKCRQHQNSSSFDWYTHWQEKSSHNWSLLSNYEIQTHKQIEC